MFHFLQEVRRRISKGIFSFEIGNDIFIYINIKQMLFDSLTKSTLYVYVYVFFILIWREIALYTNIEGSPNSLTESYFTGELRLGEF